MSDEQENFTIDGYLYLASLLTLLEITLMHGDMIEFRHNGYHGHMYPLSHGDITSARLSEQDYSRLMGTLASAR